jgi:uncharacterized membrane protein HdeD (DUF308 family)
VTYEDDFRQTPVAAGLRGFQQNLSAVEDEIVGRNRGHPPYDAFWALASILGLLLIFQGTFYILTSVSTRDVNSIWWLGLVVGILEILLGFWASRSKERCCCSGSASSPCSAASQKS